ncbi:2,3-bisphosphoglycerate-independent phosphoglycerate mutase [Anaerotardibacter muris]|uniref:2,3-bisphosphoglycerate-independent phosphoglycerate mutase n=1 Tax=Anaerotardibacter muris TaxID=2941505 RepID=UPI00203C557C|nr:2,3-bisphosphoglycerate-independent phosphoglycerate mutase [Anaerotardibacter muris]
MTEQNPELTLPACLIIMDGFGLAEPGKGNAISLANTPNLDALFASCPHIELDASGKPVGLPDGQMGNSEVGHLNIGAGRTVFQELSRIDNACADGSLFTNEVLVDAMQGVVKADSTLHLMGLLSDGGVHSNNEHLYSLLEMANQQGVRKIRVHCFMDGRDVPPQSGIEYIEQLEQKIDEIFSGDDRVDVKIGVISGRYYAMDRDNRWDRVEKAWRSIWLGENPSTKTPREAVEASYAEGVTDEFIVPVNLTGEAVQSGDAFIFFNFRPDRAREITRAICDEAFDHFDRPRWGKLTFVCLTEYDPTIPAPIAFPKENPSHVLADILSEHGLRQYHIAETEKYAHVTFFFNGGVEDPKPLETRKLIASPKVATYDLQPEMSEPEVTDALVAAIDNDEADVYIVNFANCDMVGHTGVIDAAVKAVEAVDDGVGKVVEAIRRKGGVALITADHGNADCMIAEDGTPFTAHTTAPVPFILVDAAEKGYSLKDTRGILANISPTLLEMIGIAVPEEMTAGSLLVK